MPATSVEKSASSSHQTATIFRATVYSILGKLSFKQKFPPLLLSGQVTEDLYSAVQEYVFYIF